MSDADTVYFPEPNEIEEHALAFATMMFSHAAFEREVRELQDAITGQHGFGERPNSKWSARERPRRMLKLMRQHRGSLPQKGSIKKLLTDAIGPTDQRNMLAHGTWWCFNRRTSAICVRGTMRWESKDEPPEFFDYTVAEIRALSATFVDLGAKLYPLRREIEQQSTNEEGGRKRSPRRTAGFVVALLTILVVGFAIAYFLR